MGENIIESFQQTNFPTEIIASNQSLYYRINKVNIEIEETGKKRIKPVAFDPMPKPDSVELSVEWSKYTTPEETKQRARKPENNGVLSFNSDKIRNKPVNLDVRHHPTQLNPITGYHNQSHSLVFNVLSAENDPEIRLKLRDICEWEIYI